MLADRDPGDPLSGIPAPSARRLAVRVTPIAKRALRGGHPWLFDQAVTDLSGEGQPGDLAVIFDDGRRFLAIGLYDPASPIRVRVLQQGEPATIDRAWLAERLAAAAAWRATAARHADTTGYRLVHGENDGARRAGGRPLRRHPGGQAVHRGLAAVAGRPAGGAGRGHPAARRARVVLRLSRDLVRRPERLYGLADGVCWPGPRSTAR